MESKELFKKACNIAKNCEQTRELNLDQLLEYGFSKIDLNETEKSLTRYPNLLYSIDCEDRNRIEIRAYAYDPTKTFSPIEPDMNKIYIDILDENQNKIDHYHIYFSDPK